MGLVTSETHILIGKSKDGAIYQVSVDDLEGLERARVEIETALASIEMQLHEASGKAANGEGYSAPQWYSRLIGAKKFKGIAHQRILRRIKELKMVSKIAAERTRERLFIEACKRRLNRELYLSIWAEVDDEAAHTQAELTR